jgi:hypothetical protein
LTASVPFASEESNTFMRRRVEAELIEACCRAERHHAVGEGDPDAAVRAGREVRRAPGATLADRRAGPSPRRTSS